MNLKNLDIRKKLDKVGITQKKLAAHMGKSYVTISRDLSMDLSEVKRHEILEAIKEIKAEMGM